MKVILYMAITANGMVAHKNHDTPWTDDEFKAYSNKVKELGNLITGSTTYPLYEDDDFEDLGNPVVIVLTKKKFEKRNPNHLSATSHKEALKILEKKGFETALLGGGTITNTSALAENLIDEIYLDIEPFIIGDGIPLFNTINKSLDLELLNVKKTGTSSVQLHYKVIK